MAKRVAFINKKSLELIDHCAYPELGMCTEPFEMIGGENG